MSRHLGRLSRCVGCRLQLHLCVCRYVRPVETETRIVVVLHAKEQSKPTNTGHLARRVLPSATLRVATLAGRIDGPPLEPDPGRRAFLLFPRADARVLEPPLQHQGPITLVVPDAHWRQARKMATRWPRLRELPAVTLPEGPPRTFALRKTKHGPSALGTLEAIGRAIGILEGPEAEEAIQSLHERVVRHGLYARGRAPADERLAEQLAEARARGIELP